MHCILKSDKVRNFRYFPDIFPLRKYQIAQTRVEKRHVETLTS